MSVVTRLVLTRHVMRHALATSAVAGVVAASQFISAPEPVIDLAVSVHILGLVLAFGSILLVDWTGLAWLAGLRRFRETLRVAEAATPLVWFGIGLLLLSGLFLDPDLGHWRAWAKLTCVLLLVNNGLVVGVIEQQLDALPPRVTMDRIPGPVRRRMMGTLVVSQSCWWLATLIGLWVSADRR